MNKKILIIIAVIIAVLLVIVAAMTTRKAHTVADFALFPCQFDQAKAVTIEAHGSRLELAEKRQGEWVITAPYKENIAREPHTELMRFLTARMFIDETATDASRENMRKSDATHVTFLGADGQLCAFELGNGYKLPTVDAERRWIFPDGSATAYRTFVPLMDFGQLFEQPFGGWRERVMMKIPAAQFARIEISAPNEKFVLERVEGGGVEDYALVSANKDGADLDTAGFEIDKLRVATLIDLATPLIIDDWATGVDDSTFAYNGRLTIRTKDGAQFMEIGPEVDFSAYPQWAYLGAGARFVRSMVGQVGIVSAQRLLGLFPALNDFRAKLVWNVDTTRLSAIDVRVGESCLQYIPVSKESWAGRPCAWLENNKLAGEQPQPLDMKALALVAQTIAKLQAVRYAETDEIATNGADLAHPAAEVRLYFDLHESPDYSLVLSNPVKSLYRYGFVRGSQGDGVPFVLSEGMVKLLLGDMRAP